MGFARDVCDRVVFMDGGEILEMDTPERFFSAPQRGGDVKVRVSMRFASTAAMYTLKQLEAFYWSSELGSFSASSRKLHTTQSAVAKRVGELEAFAGSPLFERRAKKLPHRAEHGRSGQFRRRAAAGRDRTGGHDLAGAADQSDQPALPPRAADARDRWRHHAVRKAGAGPDRPGHHARAVLELPVRLHAFGRRHQCLDGQPRAGHRFRSPPDAAGPGAVPRDFAAYEFGLVAPV
ncbi:hypothetical protein G6F65_018085 [Rhizopus arrhizus]|nr:hypothetical protein G6F65_018085 [Rhizopus arrhizus]